MLLNLLRRAVLDREIDAHALWGAAEMWRGWFLESMLGPRGFCHLQAEIRGFPKHSAEQFRAALATAATGCAVALVDSDTVCISVPSSPADQPCNISGWLAAVQTPQADGLFVILRNRIEQKSEAQHRAKSVNEIALAGLVQNGKLLLKGVWRVGTAREFERSAILTWEGEQPFLDALHHFLEACRPLTANDTHQQYLERLTWAQKATHRHFLKAVGDPFVSGRAERWALWYVRQFVTFPNEASPAAFLRRFIFPLAVIAFFVALAIITRRNFLAWPAIVGVGLLLHVIWSKISLMRLYHRSYSNVLRKVYSCDIDYEIVDWNSTQVSRDPYALKLSAEIESAGASHCFDLLTKGMPDRMPGICRVFLLPEHHTTITLLVMPGNPGLQSFPANTILMLATYFEPDIKFNTINGGAGYRKNRTHNQFGRVLLGETDVASLLQSHINDVQEQIRKRARVPNPVLASSVIQTMKLEHQQTCEFYANHPAYSWGDALHEAFGIVRKPVL